MRDSILDLLYSLPLGNFVVSRELPYTESGTELYFRNPKTVYVDYETEESLPLFVTLNSADINTTVSSVAVYFTTDAKKLTPHLNNMISGIKGLKSQIVSPGSNRRDVLHTIQYVEDLMLVTVEFRFTKIT